jgi:tRNA(Ile)-lysidine synthase
MLNSFLVFCKQQHLFHPKERFLLAVSGGIDSVVMAYIFKEAGLCFGIAHCNFSLRGKESEADELFVKKLSASLGVECYTTRFDTNKYAETHKLSIQEAARELRYDWFEKTRRKHKFKYICTAHHGDDSIETFFINLLRGTGLAGLTGIPLRNKRVIRPILFASKKDILQYAVQKKIKYREDSSNEGDDYLRNRLRHMLVPLLEELSPSFRQTMLGDMQRLDDTRVAMDHLFSKYKSEMLRKSDSQWYIMFADLKGKEPLRFWLFHLLHEFGFHQSVIDNLCTLLSQKFKSGKLVRNDKFELHVERDRLSIRKKSRNKEQIQSIKINKDIRVLSTPFPLTIEMLSFNKSIPFPTESGIACLDAAKLEFPLVLRKWKIGDRFQPLGMKGSKLLSDFFSDQKFSSKAKEDVWVLESKGKIAWIVGHRIDERFKLRPETEKAFLFRLS